MAASKKSAQTPASFRTPFFMPDRDQMISGFLKILTTVPNLRGSFCLYNGGFIANLVCILLLPILEHNFKTKQQRLDMRNSDAVLFE